jgi:hypothetical protein
MKTILLALVVTLGFLGGCATTATIDPVALETADYGSYPSDYQEAVKAYFQKKLKDPHSAQYRFKEPYKAYIRETPIQGGKPTTFGYIVDVWVNAKNSFGGYTGENFHRVFIRNNVAIGTVSPNPWFSEPWYQ